MSRGGNYKTSKIVGGESLTTSTSTVNTQIKSANGLCPKKNYFKSQNPNENYVFMSGTVQPPYNMEREFEMQGVT
jgi:hypothetical protein